MGLAQQTALDSAALFGDMGTGMGMAEDAAGDMAMSLTQLSADLASFKNVKQDVASTALKGIFTGETESLKTLGIVMTEANLKQYALSQGMSDNISKMTQAEKINLRYAYVMSVTSKAQGDFERTGGGMANQSRMLIEQIKELGVQFGQILLPSALKIVKALNDFAKSIKNLSPETKTMIINIAKVVAVLGPLLLVMGKVIAGALKMKKGFLAAKAGMSALTLATGVTLGPLVAIVAGIAGVVTAGVLLKNALSKEVIPEVDLFADKVETSTDSIIDANGKMTQNIETTRTKISDATREAVGAYMNLDDEATKELQDLYVNSETITEEIKKTMIERYAEMNDTIIQGLNKRYAEEYDIMQTFFNDSTALTEQEEQDALDAMTENLNEQVEKQNEYEETIASIMQKATDEKRELTKNERDEINRIQGEMKENAIETLSESEIEAQIILERIKDYGTRITAEQASEEIKNANNARDGVVEEAQRKYNETVAIITRMRDESHVITSDQADILIADAERERDGTIKSADEMKTKSIDKIFSMNSSLENDVDRTTGNILTYWGKVKRWWDNWFPKEKSLTTKTNRTFLNSGFLGGFATGTKNAPKGTAWVGEEGPELINFKGGESVFDADTSSLINENAQKAISNTKGPSFSGISSNLGMSSSGQTINITIPQQTTAMVDLNGTAIGNIIMPQINRKIKLGGGNV